MQYFNILLVLVVLTAQCVFALHPRARPSMLASMAKQSDIVAQGFDQLQKYYNFQKLSAQDMTVECALCGIAVNEVLGLLLENATDAEIKEVIVKEFCDKLDGDLKAACTVFSNEVPAIIKTIENRYTVSAVCVEAGFCKRPLDSHHKDPVDVPVYEINLDLPPEQRLTHICSEPHFQSDAQYLVGTIKKIAPKLVSALGDLGQLLVDYYYPYELAGEIKGCSKELGVSYGWVGLLNLGYEVSDACTSIIAANNQGQIVHARNLDFWAGMGFTDTLKNMTYEAHYKRGNRTVYKTSTLAGYVGALSGIVPGGFSVTVDTRFYPQGIKELFLEVIAAIEERNASLVTFLTRETLDKEHDYDAALTALTKTELIADVYYILAGLKTGSVISRNRLNATDVWTLDPPSRWFEVETNYDHWKPPPIYDNRRDPANAHMNALGRDHVTPDNMMTIMGMKPTLNLQTTYTIVSNPSTGEYFTKTRWCPYPCTQ